MKYYNSKRFLSRIADRFGRAVLVAAGVLAVGAALTASAADWTDANDNEYNALKYLKGNATANNAGGPWLVLTNVAINCSDTIKMKFNLDPAKMSFSQALWCSRRNSSTYFMSIYNPTVNGIQFYRKTSSAQQHSKQIAGDTDYTVIADYNTRKFSINGSEEELSSLSDDTFTDLSPLMLFATYTAGTTVKYRTNPNGNRAAYQFYYLQICSSDGTLRHNLMPATNTTANTVGLYDTVTRSFFTPDYSYYSYKFTPAEWGANDRAGKKWTGLGADNKMSTATNWANNDKPGAGDDIDFTIAVPFAEIDADINATFGKVYLGAADLPSFTGSLTATDINDLERMTAYDTATAAFTFTLAAPSGQDFTWNGGAAANWNTSDASWLCNGADSAWYDNNNAIFLTADAEATLAADVTANSLVFNANATISGSSTLTVPSVTVASGVAATISAPTAGTLEKTGAGTLTLGSSRTDATTLSEGTLELSGTALLDWTKFTLGTDAAKPVILEFGTTAAFSSVPSTWKIGNEANITSTIVKNGGDWTTPTHIVIGNANGASTTFINESGNFTSSGNFRVGDSGSATLVVNGGTAGSTSSSSSQVFVGYTGEGTLVVTNGGVFSANQSLFVARSANGTINVADRGCVHAGADIVFNYNNTDGRGVVNLGRGGVVEANRAYRSNAGSSSFNFDGGTFRRLAAGDFFAANNDAAAIDVTVSANGGTLDNNGFAVGLPRTITGAGGITLIGSGKTTVSADQSYLGTTTVSNETTLSVSGGVTLAGPVVFEAGAALDIAGYDGTTPLAATAITFPEYGTVPLTLNGGAFAEGIYTVCSAPGLTAADGEKFSLATENDLASSWSVEDDTLVLTVGIVDPNAWTGRGGDGRMSTAANWGGGEVPAAGADIDLSGISADTMIIADANRTFGAVTMGDGVITFTNSFAATSFSDTSKVAVAVDSTVTVVGDLVFSGSAQEYICHSVAAGGRFVVTGDIRSEKTEGHLYPSGEKSNPGVISAKGLVNNATNSDGFDLVRVSANWEIGANGIYGTKRFRVQDYSNVAVMITATTNFTVSADIVQYRSLTLDTAGYEISLGTDTSAKSGGILGGAANGLTTVTGTGRVIVNYNVNDLSSSASSRTNAFIVATGATLTLAPGGNIGFGDLTVQDGGTLEIQSGTTTFGNLTVEENAILSFNFTDRRNAPVLALYDGAEVTAQDPFTVKVSGTVWPSSGEKLLTTCGGFDGIHLTLSAAGNAARWANQDRLSVNTDGNLVLDVKPMGTVILFR